MDVQFNVGCELQCEHGVPHIQQQISGVIIRTCLEESRSKSQPRNWES